MFFQSLIYVLFSLFFLIHPTSEAGNGPRLQYIGPGGYDRTGKPWNKRECGRGLRQQTAPLIQDAEATRLNALVRSERQFTSLLKIMPQIRRNDLMNVADKIARQEDLSMQERLLIILVRLALDNPTPLNGEEAYDQIADAMQEVETHYLPESTLRKWREETGTRRQKKALVRDAYNAYQFRDKDYDYRENAFPKAFSEVLKPPAMRYNRPRLFKGKSVITQLNHITIIDNETGAVEIQLIDPKLRDEVKPGSPLIVAIYENKEYFQNLPKRPRQWVLYDKPARDGVKVWERVLE